MLTVLKLAAPVMAAMLTQTFVNLFDTIVIGYLPTEYSIAGQAALGYSVILHWMVGGFVGAISVGTQAITARRMGENNKLGAGQVLFNSAMIALVVGTVVSILAAIYTRPLFKLFTSNEQVLAQGVPYCRARFIGILGMVGTLSFKSFFDGLGKTHYHLVAAIIMNVVNMFLVYVLVFGALGFPQMFVLGSGVGSCIASFVGLGVMMGYALRRKYRIDFAIFRLRNFNWGITKSIVKLSVPSGLATVAVMTGFLLFFKIVGLLDAATMGETGNAIENARIPWLYSVLPFGMSQESFIEVLHTRPPILEAATKVLIDILSISFMSCMGLGIATATLVSQNLGRRQPDEAARYAWTAVRLGIVFTGLMGIIALVFPDAFLGLFTQDQEVVEAGRTPLRIMGVAEFVMGMALVLTQALFGAGNTKFVLFTELTLHFLCLVPLSYILGITAGLGISGVFLAVATYVVLLATTMAWKFRSGSWKHIQL